MLELWDSQKIVKSTRNDVKAVFTKFPTNDIFSSVLIMKIYHNHFLKCKSYLHDRRRRTDHHGDKNRQIRWSNFNDPFQNKSFNLMGVDEWRLYLFLEPFWSRFSLNNWQGWSGRAQRPHSEQWFHENLTHLEQSWQCL